MVRAGWCRYRPDLSISAADLAPFVGLNCSGVEITVLDLSRNSLTMGSIGPDLLAGFLQPMAIDLSHNALTHDAIDGLFNSNAPGGCALCSVTVSALDLGYNNIGPSFPLALRLINAAVSLRVRLFLISCGLTDLPSESLLGSKIVTLELALNDLSNGLHPFSFAGATVSLGRTTSVSCAYCNLRTASLPIGVFHSVPSLDGLMALNLANEILPATFDSYVPRTYLNDTRLFSKDRFTPPSASKYEYRLPTPKEYLDSWSNCFFDLPSSTLFNTSVMTAPSGANYSQAILKTLALGGALVAGLPVTPLYLDMTIDLAPQLARVALGLLIEHDFFCPLHSLAASLSKTDLVSQGLKSLILRAYDQPFPSLKSKCAFPTCEGSLHCSDNVLTTVALVELPTEPSFLVREVGDWLAGAGFSSRLVYTPPRFAIWNTGLDQPSWVPTDLLCGLPLRQVVMPALPWSNDPWQASMPYAPPEDMLACITRTMTTDIDWSSAAKFSGGMLRGLQSSANYLTLTLNLGRLWGDLETVPAGFFDSIADTPVNLMSSVDCPEMSVDGPCFRMRSTCPAWVTGRCKPCYPGGTPTSFTAKAMPKNVGSLTYCKACPIGHFCDPKLGPSPIPCAKGTFQPATGWPWCQRCPAGTFSSYTARTDPSACTLCPPGKYNPNTGSSGPESCLDCLPGTASSTSGIDECPTCPPGRFQRLPGQRECNLCPENTFSVAANATDSSVCQNCPDATPMSSAGSSSVVQCTAFSQWCEPGMFGLQGDTVVCRHECHKGSACMEGVVTECRAGEYTDEIGQNHCTPCGLGYFGFRNGSITIEDCLPCAPSSFSSELVSAVCELCLVGKASDQTAQSSIWSCKVVPGCLTATSLPGAVGTSTSSNASFCLLGGTTPIRLGQLTQTCLVSLRDFFAAAALANRTALESTGQTDAISALVPIKINPSLRLAAFDEDEVLTDFDAMAAAFSNTSTSRVLDPTKSTLSDTGAYALFAVLLCVAFIPWLGYRWLPVRIALYLDQFKLSHLTHIGESAVNSPTQFGAIVTWSFVWVAILVAVLLGTESNTISTTELVPPSAAEFSNTAQANFQLTLRAYTGESAEEMTRWCNADTDGTSLLIQGQNGFTSPMTTRVQAAKGGSQSCDIAVDCRSCGMGAMAYVTFALPFNAQLVEWELWVNSAQKGSWSRAYAVRVAPPETLLPAHSTLTFTAIESYFVDSRGVASSTALSSWTSHSGSKRATRSGFEFNFASATTSDVQMIEAFSAASKVNMTFAFKKSDIILRTQLTNKQTALQILAVVASTVVSLFALFGIAFKLLEGHLFKRCGWSTGPIVRDESGQVRLRETSSSSDKAKAAAAAAPSTDSHEIELDVAAINPNSILQQEAASDAAQL